MDKIDTDHRNGNNTAADLFGQKAYAKILSYIHAQDTDHIPPLVDDITARSVNRLGGYMTFFKRAKLAESTVIEQEFCAIFAEFYARKLEGQYRDDRLPYLHGSKTCKCSVRYLPSPECSEVAI